MTDEAKRAEQRICYQRWLARHPEKRAEINERTRKWRANNKERQKAAYKRWVAANRDKVNAAAKRYRNRYPEKTQQYLAEWRRKNREHISAYGSTRRIARSAEQVERDREKDRQLSSYKRVRRRGKPSDGPSFTGADVAEIRQLQRNKCGYCRAQLNQKYHVDHITPIASGGSNRRSNIQILCAPCNLRKSARDPIVFAQMMGMLL